MILHQLTHYLILGAFALLLFIPGITRIPVIDRDEAHFAQASRQMLQTGNYFQIRFQEGTRFQKPPGINWLQAASVKLLSHADAVAIWPYRVPSILGALLSVWLTYFFSRRFVGQTVAVFGAAFLASSLLVIVEARMAVIDTSLLSAVVLMQGSLWQIYQAAMDNKKTHWGWALCFWLAMAYGFLLKGVTPLVGGLTITALCMSEKRIDWLRNLYPFWGILFFISLSASWLLGLNKAENANYLLKMVNKDLLPKLQGGHESHGKPPFFHLMILPLTFWPASLFLWQGGVYAFYQRHEKPVKFLLAWLLPTWLFFEIMPTKLPQYVMPTFPAIALLCALAMTKSLNGGVSSRWLHWLQMLWVILSLGFALTLVCAPYLLNQHYSSMSLIIVVLMMLTVLIAVYTAWHGFYQRASLFTLLAALLVYPLIFTYWLPQLNPIWFTARIAQVLKKEKISAQRPLLVVGFAEPSLVFNLNTQRVKFIDSMNAEKVIHADPTRIALVDSTILHDWIQPAKLIILKQIEGFNYSKGRWVKLWLVKQQKKENNEHLSL